MAKYAIKYDDAELLSAIICFEAEFLNFTFSSNSLDKIALFFELDHNTTLDLATMYARKQEFFFIPFLYNHNTISIYGDNATTVEPVTVKLRLEVYKQLQAHSVPCEFPLISSSSDIDAILTMLEGALKTGSYFEVKYLTNIITYIMEDALIHSEVYGVAHLLRGYVNLLGVMHDKEQHAILFSALGMDSGFLPVGLKLFDVESRPALMWIIANCNSVLGKIASANGVSYADLLGFKDKITRELCSLIGAKTLLRDFSGLLIEFTAKVEEARQVMPEHVMFVAEIIAHLYDRVQHLNIASNIGLFAEQVALIIQTGIKYYQKAYIAELYQIFEMDTRDLDNNIRFLAAGELGQLAWCYINNTLDIFRIAESNNIPFDQYVAFKKAVYAQLTNILGKPVLQEPEVLVKQLLAATERVVIGEDFRLIAHSGAILLREAYLQKEHEVFARLISVMADVIKQVHAVGPTGITNLVYLLKLLPEQTVELENALRTKNEQALNKLLIDIGLTYCNYYGDGVVEEQLLPTEIQSVHEMQLSCWQQQKKQNTNYRLDCKAFQAAVYTTCGLPNKTADLGNIQRRSVWDWNKVPFLTYDSGKRSFSSLEHAAEFTTILANYREATAMVLATDDFIALGQQRIVRRQLLDIARFKNEPELFADIIMHDLQCLVEANTRNHIAQVQVLLNVAADKIKFYHELLQSKSLSELCWHLMNDVDLTYCSITQGVPTDNDIVTFRAKVCSKLDKKIKNQVVADYHAINKC